MTITHGMDLAEVRRLGKSLQEKAQQIEAAIRTVDRLMANTRWNGEDADTFRTTWWPEHRRRLEGARANLYGLGQSALNNASAQEEASGAESTPTPGSTVPAAQIDQLAAQLDEFSQVSPKTVRDWWNELSQAERDALKAQHPDLVGNSDGIPFDVRIEANKRNILAEISRLKNENQALRNEIDTRLAGYRDSWDLRAQIGANDERIARFETWYANEAIVLFQPEEGFVAAAYGDLGAAEHIVVVVPGIGNDIDNFTGDDAHALQSKAGGDTATIQWLGYDTPTSATTPNPDKLSSATAERYAGNLARFTSGISATTAADVTVAAHSYGTVLATKAATDEGMQVDRVILLGSPGVPADDHTAFNGANVYAIRNPYDLVPEHSVHGTDPTAPEFGAVQLQPNESGGHSDYFKGHSLSSMNETLHSTQESHIIDGQQISRTVDEDGAVTITQVSTY